MDYGSGKYGVVSWGYWYCDFVLYKGRFIIVVIVVCGCKIDVIGCSFRIIVYVFKFLLKLWYCGMEWF